LAKDLARKLSYVYIDSGAMYRAVALYVLEENIDLNSPSEILQSLDKIDIRIQYPEGQFKIYLNNVDVTERIKLMDVSSIVSQVAAISEVRKKLVQMQKKMGKDKAVVMDGRDIGSVVFPKAELKLFVTASIDVRTNRRFLELSQKGHTPILEEVRKNLIHRDKIDSTREDSPLIMTEDAVLIDNSLMTKEEQLILAYKLAKESIQNHLSH
jgi:cytidylate kinase